jgi:hypothetical protein
MIYLVIDVFDSHVDQAWLRVLQGLHTPAQMMAGLGFGYGMATLWIWLWNHVVQKVVESSIAFHQVNVSLFVASLLYFAHYVIRSAHTADYSLTII